MRSFDRGLHMPRKSPFRIELSADESAELNRRAPELTVEIKALACELPATLGLPLSRLSVADVARHAQCSGLVARISHSTVWRWLYEDAIRPWQHRCWISPRDPHFLAKVGRILDLYERRWQRQAPRHDEFVISTDGKTSIQARLRIHPSLPTEPGKSMRVHEYARGGAWAYLAALDVHRAKVFGRCEATTGIAPFERLVDQVMSQAPYNTARRVFWVMDNGSSHRGEASVRRLTQAHSTLVPVHGPIHASWLNQIEIYFSIMQRKPCGDWQNSSTIIRMSASLAAASRMKTAATGPSHFAFLPRGASSKGAWSGSL